MADNLLRGNIDELDKYIRQEVTLYLSDTPPEYPMYTRAEKWPSSDGQYDVFIRGYQRRSIGPATRKAEDERIATQKLNSGRTKDIYTLRFGTALAFSYERLHQGIRRWNSALQPGRFLGDAMRMALETYYVGMLAEAFSTTEPELLDFAGTQPLCSSTHTLLNGETHSNVYNGYAEPSYTVFDEIISEFARIKDENGLPHPVYRLTEVWVPVELETAVFEVLQSVGRPDTANRVDNVLKSRRVLGLTKEGVKSLLYMPSDMWFCVDGSKHSLTRYTVENIQIEGPIFEDRLLQNAVWIITAWVARGWWDWRGVYGIQLAEAV